MAAGAQCDSDSDLDLGGHAGEIARGGAGPAPWGSRAPSEELVTVPDRQRLAWSLQRPQQDSREPPGQVPGARGLPRKGGCVICRHDPGTPVPSPRSVLSPAPTPPPISSPGSRRRGLRSRLGVGTGTAAARLRAPRTPCSRPASPRACSCPRHPRPAAASSCAESAPRSPGSQLGQSGRAGGGPGHAGVRNGHLGLWTSALGSRCRVGAATARPVPSREPRHALACSDFAPLCSVQEKRRKRTQIQTPLARVTLPQEKQPSYPTWWSAEAGSEAGRCSCRGLGA